MWKLVRAALVAAAVVAGTESEQTPVGDDYVCQHPAYTVSIVSRSPMVLYLHGFITPEERAHLKAVTYVVC